MATSIEWSSPPETTGIVMTKMRQNFVVISWNVLHMIHEINHVYNMSPVIDRYSIHEKWSNEKLRLNDIVKTLSDLLINHSTIECFICLQEVPGDLLPMLHEMLDSHVGSILASKPLMHIHTYSRKPRVKRGHGDSLYTDSNESLVTIHYDPRIIPNKKASGYENAEKCLPFDDRIAWIACPADPGKGAFIVTTASGLSVVNVHVPFDNRAALLLLNNIPWPNNNSPFVLVGDINHDSKALMKMLAQVNIGNPPFDSLFPVTTDKPTRVALQKNGIRYYRWIDHYVVSASLKDLAISPAVVYDSIGDISDHFPILLRFKVE